MGTILILLKNMLLTLLILKLTLEGVLKECNRMVLENETKRQLETLKSELFQLQDSFENNEISEDEVKEKEAEIIKQIQQLTKNNNEEVDQNIGF